MRPRRLAAAFASAVFSWLLATGPVVAASDIDPDVLCSDYELEMYGAEQHWGEQLHVCRGTNYYNLALLGWNDVASSLKLAHAGAGQGIRFYENIQYGGAYLRICGNANRPTLGSWDNRISSLLWVYDCPQ
jgi:hypothetical protein